LDISEDAPRHTVTACACIELAGYGAQPSRGCEGNKIGLGEAAPGLDDLPPKVYKEEGTHVVTTY